MAEKKGRKLKGLSLVGIHHGVKDILDFRGL
jgi:hypothetical protein